MTGLMWYFVTPVIEHDMFDVSDTLYGCDFY